MNKIKILIFIVVALSLFTTTSCNSRDKEIRDNANAKNETVTRYIEKEISGRAISKVPDLSDNEISELSIKGENGDGDAAYSLWDYYSWNTFESEKARYWLLKAAKNGHVGAEYELGQLFINGGGAVFDKDVERGRYWLNKVADTGDVPLAQYARIELGNKLSKEDVEVLTRLANNGHTLPSSFLIRYYEEIEKDQERANYWRRFLREQVAKQDSD